MDTNEIKQLVPAVREVTDSKGRMRLAQIAIQELELKIKNSKRFHRLYNITQLELDLRHLRKYVIFLTTQLTNELRAKRPLRRDKKIKQGLLGSSGS